MTTAKLETRESNVYCPAMLNVIPDLAYSVARDSIAPEMIVDHLEYSDASFGLHRYALWARRWRLFVEEVVRVHPRQKRRQLGLA